MRVAYIASRYPLVSHAFILREVLALRRHGATVHTFTVRRPGAEHVLSGDDREAADTTDALVPASPFELLAAHGRAFLASPGRYLRTLRLALALRPPGLRGALWQLFYFAEAGLMWSRCRRLDVRHIHAHHANVASDVALLATRLGGPGWTWSFTLHGPTELFDAREHRLAPKAEHATFVACITDYARSQLMGMVGTEHWRKLRVVHCGVDLGAYPLVDRSGRTRASEVLTVGRLVPVKGQALLIEAVAELARRDLAVRLTVVGDGPQLEELRELASRLGVSAQVDFDGAVGQDEMPGYYARADVFAMASFAEGLPVVLMEAMATGMPVVASRITGVPELVEPGVNGLLVTPARAGELADALEALLRAPAEERVAMGLEGRRAVEEGFDVDRNARDLLDLFEEFGPLEDVARQPPAPAAVGGG